MKLTKQQKRFVRRLLSSIYPAPYFCLVEVSNFMYKNRNRELNNYIQRAISYLEWWKEEMFAQYLELEKQLVKSDDKHALLRKMLIISSKYNF